jgi:hypothetical protein
MTNSKTFEQFAKLDQTPERRDSLPERKLEMPERS